MNVYGQAMPETKRQANSKIVQMVLRDPKGRLERLDWGWFLLMGVFGGLPRGSQTAQPIDLIGCGGRI